MTRLWGKTRMMGLSQGAMLAAAAVLSFLSGCASTPPGQTERAGLFDIWGKMKSPHSLRGAPRDKSHGEQDDGDSEEITQKFPELKNLALHWPLKAVQVTSRFGRRGSDFHEGVDLRARLGTPVFASQSGTVLYAGSKLRGYGRMVVIGHRNGIATVYAHNSKILVRRGQKIIQGTQIALSGKTGRARGPHLHFEVRDGSKAVDPLKLLPTTAHASMPAPAVAHLASK